MSNFDNIGAGFYTQFKDDVYMLARQDMSLYLPHVDTIMTEKKAGERVVIPRMGKVTAQKVTGRYEELEANTAPMSARSCVMDKYRAHITLDEIDDIKMLFDPTQPYIKTVSAALIEKINEIARSALVGDADNEDGSSSTAFDTSNQEVDSGSAITVAKLAEVKDKFQKAYAGNKPTVGFIESAGYIDMTGLTEVNSADYANNKPLVEGAFSRFLGMDFKYDPDMPLHSDGSSNQGLFFTRDALAICLPKDISISIDRIPNRGNAILIQAHFVMGAVRKEENQVVILKHT